jgi:RND family efflux transporter MFP subunit
MNIIIKLTRAIMVISAFLFAFSCAEKAQVKPPAPPEVMVAVPLEKRITDYMIFTGQTAEYESVEVRARVEGWLEKTFFDAGAKISEGDLLFKIDPKPFQALVDQRKAELAAKRADMNLAATNLKRSEQLLDKASISQLQYDESKAKALVAKAQLQIAEANLQQAELKLSYTDVTSPINGRANRAYVDDGNLVGAGEKTTLTEVVNNEKIYFYFDLSERDYLKLRRMFPNRDPDDRKDAVQVGVQLADEKDYPHVGKIDFAEPKLDPGTGALQARALFENKDGLMIAGLFGRIRIPIRQRKALLIPELAIGTAQSGRYVMVVGKDNKVERRLLELGAQKGQMRVVEKGLQKDDLVVVNAIQRARPGRPVKPKTVSIEDQFKEPSSKASQDEQNKGSNPKKTD